MRHLRATRSLTSRRIVATADAGSFAADQSHASTVAPRKDGPRRWSARRAPRARPRYDNAQRAHQGPVFERALELAYRPEHAAAARDNLQEYTRWKGGGYQGNFEGQLLY